MARSIETFGYTYPELANNADQSIIRAAVNALYAGDQSGRRASTFGRLQMAAEASTADSSLPHDHYRSYTANINSRKFAFNGSYAIYVFLGHVADEDAAAWPLSSKLVGTQGVFTGMTMPSAPSLSPASTDGTQDSNEAVGGNVMVTGTVPLTNALLKHIQTGDLASLEINDVRAFLRKNLQWRIGKVSHSVSTFDFVVFQHLCNRSADMKFLNSTTAQRLMIPAQQTSPSLSSWPRSSPRERLTSSRSRAISAL
jgi:tyrosinase